MKEDILQCRAVCVKSKRVPEGLRERDIQHSNAMKSLSHNVGAVKHFVPNNLEGGGSSQLSTPAYNLSKLLIWIKLNC